MLILESSAILGSAFINTCPDLHLFRKIFWQLALSEKITLVNLAPSLFMHSIAFSHPFTFSPSMSVCKSLLIYIFNLNSDFFITYFINCSLFKSSI